MLHRNRKFVDASVSTGFFSERKRLILPEKTLFGHYLKNEPDIMGGFAYRIRVQVLVLHVAGADIGLESDNLTYGRRKLIP